jgi:hypothetical protein
MKEEDTELCSLGGQGKICGSEYGGKSLNDFAF